MSDGQVPEGQSHDGDNAAADFQQWGDEVQADGADPVAPEADTPSGEADVLATKLAERTEDLQRIQAEYANYKKRVDRDRASARAGGIEAVATDLIPVLDAVELARANGELTGGFKLVADELERVAQKYGVTAYGEQGEVFDPHVHEALMAAPSEPGQTEPRCATVLQRGYRVGDRIVRHARVAVSEPDPAAGPTTTATEGE